MRSWSLTRQAESRLFEIAVWTKEHFGERQAAAYAEDLIEKCQALAAGTALSCDCRRLIRADMPENLRFARVGQHFVVFLDAPDRMTSVDFLNVRSDLPYQLDRLADKG